MEHLLDFEHGLTNHRQIVCYWNRFACVMLVCSNMTSTYPICLSICLSQPAVASKWANGSNCFLAQRLPLTCLTLRYMEIQVPPKIHFSGTLSKTLDFKKFHAPLTIVNLVQPRNIASSSHCV